jgi:hypothetical protein
MFERRALGELDLAGSVYVGADRLRGPVHASNSNARVLAPCPARVADVDTNAESCVTSSSDVTGSLLIWRSFSAHALRRSMNAIGPRTSASGSARVALASQESVRGPVAESRPGPVERCGATLRNAEHPGRALLPPRDSSTMRLRFRVEAALRWTALSSATSMPASSVALSAPMPESVLEANTAVGRGPASRGAFVAWRPPEHVGTSYAARWRAGRAWRIRPQGRSAVVARHLARAARRRSGVGRRSRCRLQ